MRRTMAILVLLSAGWVQADPGPDQASEAGVREFTAAYQAWDSARFRAASELFRQASAQAPSSGIIRYWLGVSYFHVMLHAQSLPATPATKAAADRALEAALESLTFALKLNSELAEVHALLGTLYGMKIRGNVFRALQLGPKVQQHRARSLKLGPENPRVRYLVGAAQFHTAKTDASRREALASLRAAAALFEAERKHEPGPLEPRWGYPSCLTFIGRTYERLDEPAQAAVYFRKALDLHPADQLAREGLVRVTAKQ